MPGGMISYRHDTGAWLNAAGKSRPGPGGTGRAGTGRREDAWQGAGGFVDLKLGHYNKDGIEVVDVEGEIDVYTAPRLRELLIDLVNKNNYQLVVNMEKVEFLDSTGLGVLVGGLKRVRAHDGSLDLVCTQERILKIFRITGLTKVFGIHGTVDDAIAAKKADR
jgi:anti-sigma B factor antagonist